MIASMNRLSIFVMKAYSRLGSAPEVSDTASLQGKF
jgi:hypothetical protein